MEFKFNFKSIRGTQASRLRARERSGRTQDGRTRTHEAEKVSRALGCVDRRWGKHPRLAGFLTELHAESKRRYVSAYAIALVHAGVGDKDEALRCPISKRKTISISIDRLKHKF